MMKRKKPVVEVTKDMGIPIQQYIQTKKSPNHSKNKCLQLEQTM